MTRVVTTVAEMQAARELLSGDVGLAPTMGYLHEGHLSLVRRSARDNQHTVVSIFVNPTQFGANEDFENYPRDTERDIGLLEAEGVDVVFMPSADEIYPPGFDDWVEVHGAMAERFEGKHRPGHFRGVATVVARLLRIVRPHRAYFGQKDAQQLRLIRRMVNELRLAVAVVPVATMREPDGLAMSSRNVLLSPPDRRAAAVLSRGLRRAEEMVRSGERDTRNIRDAVLLTMTSEPRAVVDYVAIATEETFEDLETIDRPALLLVAARVGGTRLIDNAVLIPDEVAVPEHLRDLVPRHA